MKKRVQIRIEIEDKVAERAGLILPYVGEIASALLNLYFKNVSEEKVKELFWKMNNAKIRERRRIALEALRNMFEKSES